MTTGGTLASRLLAARFPRSDDELVIGALPARALAERFGTPCYVFDAAILRENLAAVREALGPRVGVLFALKANPNAAVAQLLHAGGAGAEVASAGEIHVALRAGIGGEAMQFAGPGKHGEDLRLALREGVLLNVESAAELEAIAAAAREAGVRARVALRVNPPASMTGSRMRMSGGSAKFGIDAGALEDVARRAEALDGVALEGLHTYAGTQTFDHEGWLANARWLVERARALDAALGRRLASLNFGGGFGVPVFDKDTPFDLAAAGEGLRALIDEDGADRRYHVELGRYLVAEAGVFLTRVTYLKESNGKRFAILDGGMNQHAAATGMGTVIRRAYPMVRATRLKAPAGEEGCQLGGPLCTPADVFPTAKGLELEQGELVAFLSSGAYGLTFSNVLFLGHPAPAEVLVDGEVAEVVRAAGRPEDALRGQRLPGEAG
ncbi:MAG TPA: alanine racemase [Polyangiaceae bacterium LLY-WYZ-15_(1-7)]|nr:alanine racemase [Polyangiaceae bacterium LLY-WYZ-15_(1-7)]HJL03093.1 alanine racemase [Polyangiaceae bacterium LLY-WYZ-15_(1-7)]HJL08127.1 alanine racemase [Polyangiaceae bacterium LLY-WYZ-15_(1-7)]HJL50852.1 alanine racemase [Polyangiaceae bacterium LLY-WYZ-15_(1-7)]